LTSPFAQVDVDEVEGWWEKADDAQPSAGFLDEFGHCFLPL